MYKDNRRVIVTGATGFIGSNLTRRLVQESFEVYIIIRKNSDLNNLKDIQNKINIFVYDETNDNLLQFFKDTNAEIVFHLSSLVITEHQYQDINNIIDSNIKFGLKILEAMTLSNTRKLINTGTFWQHYQNEEYNPVCLYAATKQAFECLIEYYVQADGFKVITLKLFDTYGENDTRPKLINLLKQFSIEKKQLSMSLGMQKLDLLHVEDVVRGFIIAGNQVETIKGHQKYALSSGNVIKLKDLVNLFENITGRTINISWSKPYRKREVMEPWNQYTLLPNWLPSINIEEGIMKLRD